MNTIGIKENWSLLQRKLHQKYPKLTKADLLYEDGKKQDMLRMVEYKLRKTKIEMQEIIEDL